MKKILLILSIVLITNLEGLSLGFPYSLSKKKKSIEITNDLKKSKLKIEKKIETKFYFSTKINRILFDIPIYIIEKMIK